MTGEKVLHLCAENNQVELFKFFVKDYAANISAKNIKGETPFIIAAREGKTEICQLFIDEYMNETIKGADPQWHIDFKTLDGWTALMYASMNGFATLCELLVKEGGADINHTDKFHRTSLHWACRFDGVIVCKRLLDLNAKTNLTDIEG